MARFALLFASLFAYTAFVAVVAAYGFVFPIRSARLLIVWLAVLGLSVAVAGSATYATVRRMYLIVRGAKNREAGIPCVHCGRTAFPIEGTGVRYRCWNCGNRFDGPRHLD
jgi:hypothetical protein